MRTTLSCLDTYAHWVMTDRKEEGVPFKMVLQGGLLALRVAKSDDRVHLAATQTLTPYRDPERGEYRCKTDRYSYTITGSDERTEMVSWHWHPETYHAPHVHVPSLDRHHIPSGRVTFESVVRFLIEDVGVGPARSDWATVLVQEEQSHLDFRSWS